MRTNLDLEDWAKIHKEHDKKFKTLSCKKPILFQGKYVPCAKCKNCKINFHNTRLAAKALGYIPTKYGILKEI